MRVPAPRIDLGQARSNAGTTATSRVRLMRDVPDTKALQSVF
jgi:hypothetical protein